MPPQPLALAFASTIRHDGDGGVADDIAGPAGLAAWLAAQGLADTGTDAAAIHGEVLALRRAVRALFAYAVRPGPASRVESASPLMPREEAVAVVNAAAALVPVTPSLMWMDDAAPYAELSEVDGQVNERVVALLARAVIELLAGPDRVRLRACTAPRCVRYFLQEHGRQRWCKTSCGNRARVARHYERNRAGGTGRA